MTTLLRYLDQIQSTEAERDSQLLKDGTLLSRFINQQDERAFLVLLRRHGPMVASICQQFLSNPADAEDAFQATFLVLVHRAATVQNQNALRSWLYGVALRVARRAKARAQNLPAYQPEESSDASPESDAILNEHQLIVHEEIARLPEKYRGVVLSFYLEEKTQEQVARELGVSKGVVKGRLERARKLLRLRLADRGITLTTVLLMATLKLSDVSAASIESATRLSSLFAHSLESTEAMIPPSVSTLVQGALQTMRFNKAILSIMWCTVLCLGIGAGLYFFQPAGAAERSTLKIVRQAKKLAPVRPKTQWGELRGQFIFKGNIPKIPPIPQIARRGHYRTIPIKSESFVVGRNGELANVVFYLVQKPKVIHPSLRNPKPEAYVKIVDGQFSPRILPVQAGQTLVLTNLDPTTNNVNSSTTRNPPFNILLPKDQGWKRVLKNAETHPTRIASMIYTWMCGYLLVKDHPYVAVTDRNGSFVIRNLPVGTWEVRAWHEMLGYLKLPGGKARGTKVKIRPGKNNLGVVDVKLKK